jgi:Fe2+ transport system protein FeoA
MQKETDVNKEVPLSSLIQGEAATITRLTVQGMQRTRLLDLGFVPGTLIVHEMGSPLGDPTAYLVKGSLIALRKDQAAEVFVQKESLL